MKKFLYIGAMSAILLAACGEAEKPIPENKTIEYPKQAKEDTELKAKEEEAEKKAKVEEELTVNEAKELIEYSSMGESDKLISLTVENGEIKAVIDLAPSEFNLPPENVAVTTYQMASEELLTEEGWNTLTIEFVDIGTISMNVSEKETNELGTPYFPVAVITERLK